MGVGRKRMKALFFKVQANIGKVMLFAMFIGGGIWASSRLADVMTATVSHYVSGGGRPLPECKTRPLHNLYGIVRVERYSQGGYGLITIDSETGQKIRTYVEDVTLIADRATKWPWAAIMYTGEADRGMCLEHAWVRVRSRKDVVSRR